MSVLILTITFAILKTYFHFLALLRGGGAFTRNIWGKRPPMFFNQLDMCNEGAFARAILNYFHVHLLVLQ